ncbi:DUF1810 domain-containing protein [Nakamurella sp.]|uniref:DUF1810 domain-containing protein n=1 Tax=Nakamurella sp. TaxID=1869182 RepID=UPI003B3A9166
MTGSADPFDLERFVEAQDLGGMYDRALAELHRGRKSSHWIWFVFPQIAGLGSSLMAQRFAIGSLAEAAAYLAHPVLGPRLRDAAQAVLATDARRAEAVLGSIDAIKLRSSMTLFHRADPAEPVFVRVLDRFYGGRPDPATDELLAPADPR